MTDSILYCPPPLTNYREVCVTVGGNLFADNTTTADATNTTMTTVMSTANTAAATTTEPVSSVIVATPSATIVPNKSVAAGRAGGAIGGVAAMSAVAVALWML